MTTENPNPLSEDQLSTVLEDAEPTEEEAQAEFEAGFDGKESPAQEQPTDQSQDDDKNESLQENDTTGDQESQEESDKQSIDQDEKQETVQELLERLDQRVTKFMTDTGGKVGRMDQRLNQLSEIAKSATAEQGKTSPSDERIEKAITDNEEWIKLEQEYPEFAGQLKKTMMIVDKRLNENKVSTVSNDSRKEIINELIESTDHRFNNFREFIKVDNKYPGWDDTVKTDAFKEWLAVQPLDVQALAASDYSKDAIKLLDRYDAYQDAQAPHSLNKSNASESGKSDQASTDANQQKPTDNSRQKQARLDAAVSPTKASSGTRKSTPSDEDDFLAGYSSG